MKADAAKQAKSAAKNEPKVGEDVAEREFQRFTTALRAKPVLERMNRDQLRDYENNKTTVLDGFRDGSLVVDNKGQPVYTPRCDFNGKLVFKKPTGATLMAADGLSDDEGVKKTFRMLAQLTGHNEPELQTLDMADLRVPLAIVAVLLA